MKKYIFIALAAAGTMACSKLTPVDSIPVTELPEDETTETVAPKEGETITIQLAQTKVTLNGTDYVFEGNEQIVVKADSGPVATISNSTDYPNTFTGVFEKPLGKKNPSFDFYYNCTDASGNPNYEQNGQPWLEHKAVPATRAKDGGYAYYVVEEVQLRQPEGYVALAITSDDYDCTVSFNTLPKDPQTVGKTIEGIAVSAGKPYFLNVSKEDLTEGFYLAVNKKGETGTMYTSYGSGSSASIDKNTSVKVKAFTPLSISGSLTGFETTYDLYKTKGAAFANEKSNDYMARGKLKISVQGISNSLLSLVSLDSITITSSDKQTLGSSKDRPKWSNKEYTWDFDAESSHTTWGELTITATAVFNTPAGKVTAEVPALSRHITGLPYKKDFTTDKNVAGWYLTGNEYYDDGYIIGYYYSVSGKNYRYDIFSPTFYIPKENTINAKYNVSVKWWNTGSNLSSGSSTLHTGITSNNQKKSDKTATLTEKISQQSLTLSDEQAELSESKNQVITYIDSASWPKLVQHFVLYNKFEIYYR